MISRAARCGVRLAYYGEEVTTVINFNAKTAFKVFDIVVEWTT